MTTSLDKSGRTIQEMFAGVAPRYDLLNRLLSARRDIAWRRRAAKAIAGAPPGPVLDLCAGTGDQALAIARHGRRVAAADFCLPMLALSNPKFDRFAGAGRDGRDAGGPRPGPLAADALDLPFPTGAFAGASVSFGLRNVADLDRALAELARVLAPGGRLVVLEAAVPVNRLVRGLYLLYFRHLLPALGRLLSPRGSAYRYLSDSVVEFPDRERFVARMAAAGFRDAGWTDLSAGTVCLYTGELAS